MRKQPTSGTSEGEINKKGISKFIFLTENPSETEKTQKWGKNLSFLIIT